MSSWLLGINDDDKWCIEDADSCRTIVDDIEQKRDARLIAAAPEMYEILHDYVYNFEYGRNIEIYPEARELIARIDGEECHDKTNLDS